MKLRPSLFCLLALSMIVYSSASGHAVAINQFMTTLHDRGQFNGSIIVTIRGKAVYRNAFGELNFASHRKFTPATVSNIGSVAKQFTAMTIMMLAEQHKID